MGEQNSDKLMDAFGRATEVFVEKLLEEAEIEYLNYDLQELVIWNGMGYEVSIDDETRFTIEINHIGELVSGSR